MTISVIVSEDQACRVVLGWYHSDRLPCNPLETIEVNVDRTAHYKSHTMSKFVVLHVFKRYPNTLQQAKLFFSGSIISCQV